jgi:hypothetical protein
MLLGEVVRAHRIGETELWLIYAYDDEKIELIAVHRWNV